MCCVNMDVEIKIHRSVMEDHLLVLSARCVQPRTTTRASIRVATLQGSKQVLTAKADLTLPSN